MAIQLSQVTVDRKSRDRSEGNVSFEFVLGMVVVGGLWYMIDKNQKWNKARREHVRHIDQKWKNFYAGTGPEPTVEEVRLYHEIMNARGGNPYPKDD